MDEDIRNLNIDNDSDEKIFPEVVTSTEYFYYGFWISSGILIFIFGQCIFKTCRTYYYRKQFINPHRNHEMAEECENKEML